MRIYAPNIEELFIPFFPSLDSGNEKDQFYNQGWGALCHPKRDPAKDISFHLSPAPWHPCTETGGKEGPELEDAGEKGKREKRAACAGHYCPAFAERPLVPRVC